MSRWIKIQMLLFSERPILQLKNRRMRKNMPVFKPIGNKLRLDQPRVSVLKEIGVRPVNKDKNSEKIVDSSQQGLYPPVLFLKEKQNISGSHSLNTPFQRQNKNRRNQVNKLSESSSPNNENLNISEKDQKIKNIRLGKSRSSYLTRQKNQSKLEGPKAPEISSISIQKNNELDQHVEDLLNSLRKSSKITLKLDSVAMKLHTFAAVLSSLIYKGAGQNFKQEGENLEMVSQVLENICCSVRSKMEKANISKLGANFQNLNIKVDPSEYVVQFERLTQSISKLEEMEDRQKSKIKGLQQKVQDLEALCMEKFKEMAQWEQKTYKNRVFMDKFREKADAIEKKVEQGEKQLRRINEEGEKIRTFVERQKIHPMMEYVAQEFRKVEDDIFDYAVYLQHDAKFSSLTWQPKSFTAMEKYMDQDLKNLNLFLNLDHKTLEEKIKEMKTFILDCYRKFKVKDQEMTVINRDKTESIRKFISMMEKWADNFDIKKDTLIDLRKQFVVDSQGIKQVIGLLSQTQSGDAELVDKLTKHWNNIEQNYKFGNYFY